MIYNFLEWLTGEWGRPLLDFYTAHSLVINLVVVVYGTVLWLSWRNLQQIRLRLIDAMLRQLAADPGAYTELEPAALLDEVYIPWEQAIASAGFPLVVQRWRLLPRRLSPPAVQALLPPEELSSTVLARLTKIQHGEKKIADPTSQPEKQT